MKSYEFYVKEGKKLLHAVEVHQAMIGYYATCVCEILHGGKKKSRYTIKEYAEDIGVHQKTLNEWTHVHRNVISKLQMDPSDITSDQWKIACRVSNLLRAEKRAIQEASGQSRRKGRGWNFSVLIPPERIRDLFNAEERGKSAQSQIHDFTDQIIRMKNTLRRMELSSVSHASLTSLKKNLDEASNEVTNYLLNNKGVTMTQLGELHV